MSSPRAFSIYVISVSLNVLVLVAFLNYWTDPYNQYGRNFLGVYVTTDRESKATDVQRFKHDAILLGNSREGMIPPRKLEGFRFFNGAFGGGTAEEVYYFVKHFVKDQKLVVLGIDYGQCDPVTLKGDIFAPMTANAVVSNLLNLKTAENSLRTISYRLAGKAPALELDGTFNATGWFEKYDREIPGSADLQVANFCKSGESHFNAEHGTLNFYRKIAEHLDSRGIRCVVYIPPLPAPFTSHLQSLPSFPSRDAWISELESIFPNIVNLSFSKHGNPTNFFKSDLMHLKPDASAEILNLEVIPKCKSLIYHTES